MTQEEKWIQAAYKIYKYIEKCNNEIFTAITNGKVAWGSGAMYAATGDEKYCKLSKKEEEDCCCFVIKEKIRGMKEVLIDVAGKKNYKVRSDLGY